MPDAERMPGPARDPGLQPERTALAWQRTLLASAGVTVLIGVTAARLGAPVVAVIAAVLACCSAALVAAGGRETWRSVRRTAGIVVALALTGAALALQVLVSR